MEDRICPNNWSDCLHCARERECSAGLYHGETIIEIAATVEKQINKEAAKSANVIKGLQSESDFWGWWGRSSTPNLHAKEPYKCMSGPTSPGGSGVKNCKKEKKGTKPTIYKWGSIL